MTRRPVLLLAALALLIAPAFAGPATGGGLVLKFPASQDFGGVSGKVLYIRQDLPEWMPLRCGVDGLYASAGFFPEGKTVTVLSSGLRLGSAVAGAGPLSVPVSSVSPGSTVAVAESGGALPGEAWVFRGVPEWSPGKPAAVYSAGSAGDRLAVLVKDPYQYSKLVALATFDGSGWRRGSGTFTAYDTVPYLMEAIAASNEVWVANWSLDFYTRIWCISDWGESWNLKETTCWARYLRSASGEVLLDDTGKLLCTNRLYRWDRTAAGWVNVGPSLVGVLHARLDGRLYAAASGVIKEYVSGSWQSICPLPSGISVSLLAVCPDGTFWIAGGDGRTWRKDPEGDWQDCGKVLGLSPAVLTAMPDGSVWSAVNVGDDTWAVACWSGIVWEERGRPVQGPATSVSFFPGPAGSLYVLSRGHYYYGYSGQGLWELPCALGPRS